MTDATCKLLAQHFDTAFAAPDGIKKLRELILTLAMQGKLVPQDPNDPPASELLKEIEAEKKRLVKEGRIKSPKPLPPVTDKEKPYELPLGWEWVRLGDISLSSDSGWSPQCLPEARTDNNWGVLKVSAVSWGIFNPSENKALPPGKDPKPECEVMSGDLLLSRANTDELVARSVIVNQTPPKLMMSDKIVRFSLSQFVHKSFVNFANGSLFARAYYIRNASGTSSSMKNVTRDVMSSLPIALPPLPEQHRIVAKIDELMARCDALEKLRTAQNEKRLSVHAAAIQQLLNIAKPEQHQRTQAFLAEHFGELYTVKENVTELRKTILQLAVMGKLVPDSGEARLLPLEFLLAEASINGVSKGPTNDTSATEVLRISAGTSRNDFYVDENDFKHVSLSELEVDKFRLQPNDLLACRFNGNLHYVGRFSLYRGISGRTQVNPDKLIRFRINSEEHCPRYVCYVMNANSTRSAIESMCATTAGNIGLSAGRLKTVKIPAPSLAQQHRIVAKIDQLMALCDTLEQKIAAASQKQAELLDAVMAQSQPVSQSFECVPA